MLINDGIITREELATVLPTDDRFKKGPVAIIECLQDIPCDPCVSSCPSKAISMKSGITDRPVLDAARCIGCGLCVPRCPGLAIVVLDMTHAQRSAALSLPYEMQPVPKVGQVVKGLDRTGKPVCEAKVLKVLSAKKFDRTHVVTIEIPKDRALDVRAIRVA